MISNSDDSEVKEEQAIPEDQVSLNAIKYATEEVRKLRASTFLHTSDYSDFEIAKRAFMAGVRSK